MANSSFLNNLEIEQKIIEEVVGKSVLFKGYISTTEPTGEIDNGALWYNSSTLPTTFPINVKVYNADDSEWSTETVEYTPKEFELFKLGDNSYFWFNSDWHLLNVSVFTDVSDLSTVTNPSKQTIYRVPELVYAHNNTDVDTQTFYKAINSASMTITVDSSGITLDDGSTPTTYLYSDINSTLISDWIGNGYIEVTNIFAQADFGYYEIGSTDESGYDYISTFTEETNYLLYHNPTEQVGISYFLPLSSGSGGSGDYALLSHKPKLNGITIIGDQTSEDFKISKEMTESAYENLTTEEKNNGTAYFIEGTGTSSNVNETNFNNLTNKPSINGVTLRQGLTSNDLDMYTRTQVDSKFSGVYKYRDTVATLNDLPSASQAAIGDVYYVTAENESYAWNGSAWKGIGGSVDLSEYQTKQDNNLETTSKQIVGAINELNSDKQDKLTEDNGSDITDSDSVCDVDLTNKKTTKRTFSQIWNWIKSKLSTTVSDSSTDEEIPTSKAVYDLVDDTKVSYITDKTSTVTWSTVSKTINWVISKKKQGNQYIYDCYGYTGSQSIGTVTFSTSSWGGLQLFPAVNCSLPTEISGYGNRFSYSFACDGNQFLTMQRNVDTVSFYPVRKDSNAPTSIAMTLRGVIVSGTELL